jgi:acetoin utilization deacetylase AcuC-like enzyme
MDLVKVGNRVINLDKIAHVTIMDVDVHVYFDYHGDGCHLILRNEEANDFLLLIEGILAIG